MDQESGAPLSSCVEPTLSQVAQKLPWSRSIPEGPWDYVVIGSGIGGMTTAALLAKVGKRVLILEQHYEPGGFTHTFKRKRWQWDVGVHAVGEMTQKALSGRLLHRLTDGRLKWASLGHFYEEFNYPGGFKIQFPDSPKQFHENLLAAFPEERTAIEGYLEAVREVSGMMRNYYLARAFPPGVVGRTADFLMARKAKRELQKTAKEVVESLTEDPQLRAVMLAQWGYYGARPSRAAFAMQALVTRHYLWGAYYPEGGSGEIAKELLRTVAQVGGWTTVKADVEEILIERNRVQGVRLVDGREVQATRVVSAAGIGVTVRKLLPPAHRHKTWSQGVKELPAGPAHLCLYLGFEGDIRKAGCGSANQWFYRTWDTEEQYWQLPPEGPLPKAPLLYCSFPSLKDPLHDAGPNQLHTGEVVTFVDWKDFARWQASPWQKRGEDYDAFKQRLEKSLLDQFLSEIPALRPYVRFAELSTPLSTDHFCRPVEGSIYGLQPTPERFSNEHLRPRSTVSGLFFSGSDVATMGVIGAMMGGVFAAASAEPVKAGDFIHRTRGETSS